MSAFSAVIISKKLVSDVRFPALTIRDRGYPRDKKESIFYLNGARHDTHDGGNVLRTADAATESPRGSSLPLPPPPPVPLYLPRGGYISLRSSFFPTFLSIFLSLLSLPPLPSPPPAIVSPFFHGAPCGSTYRVCRHLVVEFQRGGTFVRARARA